MPDKPTPTWTPDDAFWDEAWTDMEQRLDRERRRKPAGWWWLPLVLLIGLTVYRVWASDFFSASEKVQAEENSLIVPEKTTDEPIAVFEGNDDFTGLHPQPSTGQPGRVDVVAGPLRTRQETIIPTTTKPTDHDRRPSPTAPLPVLPFTLLPIATQPAPILEPTTPEPPKPCCPHSDYVFGGGINHYLGSERLGYYAATAYRRHLGKWFLTAELRFDHNRRSVPGSRDDLNLSDAELGIAEEERTPGPNPTLDMAQTADELRQRLVESRVSSQVAALRIGAGRSIGQKLSLSAGAGASYLFGGSGPSAIFDDTANAFRLRTTDDLINTGRLDANAAAGNTATVFTVNRWGLNAWADLDYRLYRRWYLSLGYTRDLAPLYQDNVIPLDKNRLNAGIKLVW